MISNRVVDGRAYVAEIIKTQKGKKHPNKAAVALDSLYLPIVLLVAEFRNNDEYRIYKIFKARVQKSHHLKEQHHACAI